MFYLFSPYWSLSLITKSTLLVLADSNNFNVELPET